MLSPIRELIVREIIELLDRHRLVVWYDPKGELASVFEGFARQGMAKIDARRSVLVARRDADRLWPSVVDPRAGLAAGALSCTAMVIYVPWPRAATEEERKQEPFEAYALVGAVYGADPAHKLDALSRTAMPHRRTEIDKLCSAHDNVTLDQLEALADQAGYPLLKQAFTTEDPIQVAARLIAEPELVKRALGAAGVEGELARLLRECFGFESPEDRSLLRPSFARWVLFSEFAFDIEGQVPAHTEQVQRAATPFRKAIYDVCDLLRGTENWREGYVESASEVEKTLRLGELPGDASSWGERDTFAAEDSAALRFVQAECFASRLESARRTLDLRKRSIWLREPTRAQLWQLASRALSLLEARARWHERAVTSARSVQEHLLAYTSAADGLWQVDRCQRWMERAAGDCAEREVLQPLIECAQTVYRQAIDAAQAAFLDAVARDGWPPEGPKQTQVFARLVAPALQEGGRVAYFLMDALRFEMGQDLARMLEKLGTVRVEATTTVVPATTPFGMAALLPGAETSFGCEERAGELWPTVAGKAMVTVDDRNERFRELLGDRHVDVRLHQLLDMKDAKLRERVGRASLLVVRSDDIDKAGEGTNLPSARRFMSSILDDVTRVAQRLARAGVTRMVFAADHGHVLLPEVLAGDVVREPAGEWSLSKRRCRLGRAAGSADGVRVFPAAHLGVHGPVKQVALATGFRVFAAGSAYFHEGMSLQECVVPSVVLEVQAKGDRGTAGPVVVHVTYKHPRFTQRIFLVKLKLVTLLQAELDVRVVVVAPGATVHVGQAADCEARDPETGLIRLRANIEESVAVRIYDDFKDPEVEVQVLDAAGTGVLLGSKKLKNACLD
jgi:hypothetical protein